MGPKYEEMEGASSIAAKNGTEVEAMREWKKAPKHIHELLLANAF